MADYTFTSDDNPIKIPGFYSISDMILGDLVLPIVPEELEKSIGTAQKQFQIIGGKQVNVPQGENLWTATIASFIPAMRMDSPHIPEKDKPLTPVEFMEKIEKWVEDKEPLKFEYYGEGWSIIEMVTIENPKFKEKGGDPGTIDFTFSVRKYIDPKSMQAVEDSSGNRTTNTRKTTSQKKNENTTYTVVSGDNLHKIAKAQLGDSSRWQEIYDLNKDVIKNPNLIYSGQELKLPVDSSGKAAGSDFSASTVKPEAAAKHTPTNTGKSGGSSDSHISMGAYKAAGT